VLIKKIIAILLKGSSLLTRRLWYEVPLQKPYMSSKALWVAG